MGSLTLRMGPISCPETSVSNYHYSMRNYPEEFSSQLLRRRSLKSRKFSVFLTCICLSSRLFRVTLEISLAECNIAVTPGTLTATDTCIGYHVTRFEASRKVILHTRYVCACVGAGGGRGRKTKIKKKCYPSYALRKHMCGSGWWKE
jgi:hypothetical protein